MCVVGTLEALCYGHKQNARLLSKKMFIQELITRVQREYITLTKK